MIGKGAGRAQEGHDLTTRKGCGGMTPSPLLELLTVATVRASSLRLGYGTVASHPQRDPPPFPITLLGYVLGTLPIPQRGGRPRSGVM